MTRLPNNEYLIKMTCFGSLCCVALYREKRLKETDDLLAAPGEVDPVKVAWLKISISEKHVS